ncbi:hypothetical protein FB451DRAFT_1169112 [Mycena latifolia]|nr:hypothetical protein FB451DRAFT_1169112 [Mycena latifolia]
MSNPIRRFQLRQRRHIQAPLTSIIESAASLPFPTTSPTPRAPSPHASRPPSSFHRQSSITALELNSSTTTRFEELGYAGGDWTDHQVFMDTSSCAVPRRGSPRLCDFLEGGHIHDAHDVRPNPHLRA